MNERKRFPMREDGVGPVFYFEGPDDELADKYNPDTWIGMFYEAIVGPELRTYSCTHLTLHDGTPLYQWNEDLSRRMMRRTITPQPRGKMANEVTRVRNSNAHWRIEARNLGVDPDDPDDWRYFSQLDRANGIVRSFQHHVPNAAQIDTIQAVRAAFTEVALVVLRSTAVGADQTHALRQLHEAMMTTNKAIVTA